MMPERIQLSRGKGWRMPPNSAKVDRSTILGNPFPVDVYGQQGAVDKHARWMRGQMSTREMSQSSRCDRWSDPLSQVSLVALRKWSLDHLSKLRGKNLACWCPLDQPCHADVLLELANKEPEW